MGFCSSPFSPDLLAGGGGTLWVLRDCSPPWTPARGEAGPGEVGLAEVGAVLQSREEVSGVLGHAAGEHGAFRGA